MEHHITIQIRNASFFKHYRSPMQLISYYSYKLWNNYDFLKSVSTKAQKPRLIRPLIIQTKTSDEDSINALSPEFHSITTMHLTYVHHIVSFLNYCDFASFLYHHFTSSLAPIWLHYHKSDCIITNHQT